MKLYRRAEFMKLPAGTLYCKGKPWCFEELSVKGDTFGNDWSQLGLCGIASQNCSDADDRLTAMLEEGASYPMADGYGRDGCFNDEDIFLVYEVEDLRRLHEIICQAVRVA